MRHGGGSANCLPRFSYFPLAISQKSRYNVIYNEGKYDYLYCRKEDAMNHEPMQQGEILLYDNGDKSSLSV